ncbi:phosphatidate cytidylyltransferase [Paenibacillus apiarius]|uniref:Phosphatidate cytidylyltransferase n=1 Tax=Paenibacillus apiarius TaxID=46240 RepID=A0ABT4DM15_9BACL|nr:phosphatidate cytidylyltransferase [Paenibacillus apiarius]MBN3526227.1 phosphatidate cytidylyltransferase [Paenibacillus apiarius]MCY9516139.1 phosphatidate cytidylyltransferase [Paenibacillus apiarius]MCY9518402.1 phosphatidate cytidylyltransferase [Paenibacillus apiarius]MCY9551197.1 phosphatidate cytidylyltransferase [Paenibacillus apiarius]MCY9558351.1 phosphatidate cytidylyltransferase [Paenibacillus apiarius]
MKQRIITGLIAGSLFGVLCVIGGMPYELLLLALAFAGYYEFARMHHVKPFDATSIAGYVILAIIVIPWARWSLPWSVSMETVVWFSMFVMLCMTVITKNKVSIENVSQLWLGAFYIGIGFKYMMLTRTSMGDEGLFWTLMLFAAIWASDIGAYFVGRAVGKHKLWPAISPNKTVEGALGGVITSVIIACMFHFIRPDLMTLALAFGLGLSAAVIGQIGDLIQSAYKRVRGVKDSGTLLPGHGGVLDRCDSWLIVFPFVHLIGLLTL